MRKPEANVPGQNVQALKIQRSRLRHGKSERGEPELQPVCEGAESAFGAVRGAVPISDRLRSVTVSHH